MDRYFFWVFLVAEKKKKIICVRKRKKKREEKVQKLEMGHCPIVSRYNGNCIVTWWFGRLALPGGKAVSRYNFCIVAGAA